MKKNISIIKALFFIVFLLSFSCTQEIEENPVSGDVTETPKISTVACLTVLPEGAPSVSSYKYDITLDGEICVCRYG